MELAREALTFAKGHLRDGGSFLTKVFMGEDLKPFQQELGRNFAIVKMIKPEASRSESAENYLLGKGFNIPKVKKSGEISESRKEKKK